mgnify:CR=1 FL=1
MKITKTVIGNLILLILVLIVSVILSRNIG